MVGLLEAIIRGYGPDVTEEERLARLRLGGEDTPAGGVAVPRQGGGILSMLGDSGVLSQQPQAAPQQAAQAPQNAFSAPQPSMPQSQGGGFLQRLFGGQRGPSNSTVQYLMNKGYDASAAQAIASDPDTLRRVVATVGGPQGASEYQQRQQALVQAGIDPNSAEGREFFLTGKLPQPDELPDSVQVLEWRARQAGLRPGTPEYQKFMADAGGGQNINVSTGAIPSGYQAVYDDQNRLLRYDPVPGGPADMERQAAAGKEGMRENQAAITSDTVINAAKQAREAVDGGFLPTTGTVGGFIGGTIGESNAAEVMRQTETLKAIAAAENINAMRQASPTGGALGNASDADIALLKNKAGALDPTAGAARYKAALDDYERTLLRIVHGFEAGDRIFEATRPKKDGATGKSSRPGSDRFGTDSDWQQAPNGARIRRKQ